MNKLLSTTALAVTLALCGVAYADMPPPPPPPFEEALSKLPDKDAAAFRDTMKQSHEKDKALFDQMHKLHEDLRAIIVAPTFDKDAFIAKNKELDELHHKMHAHMTAALATALSALTPDERKTFAESMHHHGGKHHHGPAGDAPPPEDN